MGMCIKVWMCVHLCMHVCLSTSVQGANPAKLYNSSKILEKHRAWRSQSSCIHLWETRNWKCASCLWKTFLALEAGLKGNRNFSTLMETSPSQVPSASSRTNCLIFTKDFEDEKISIKAENEHLLYLLFPTCSWIHRATVSLKPLQDYNHDDHPWSCKWRASSDQGWAVRGMTLPQL